MSRLELTPNELSEDERRIYERLEPLFEQERLRMARALASGWQISSGPVESACKTVAANRLKGSGMRWGENGSDAVCRLRALYLSQSGQWESFWKNYPN